MRIRRLATVLVAGILVLSSCGFGDDTTSEDSEPVIRVASSFNDPGSNAPYIVGDAKGYFDDEEVQVEVAAVQTDPRSFLVGGSAEVAMIDLPTVAQGIAEGLDLVVFGGYRCREEYAFAAQPEVDEASDLTGRPVFLNGRPGVPIVDYRMELLAEAGWDISDVDVDFIDLPSGGREPSELFANKSIDLLYFYSSDLEALQQANARIIYDDYTQWPNEVLVTTRTWFEENRDVAERLLRAMMKALDDFLEPDSREEFLEAADEGGYDMTGAGAFFDASQYIYCSNLYLNSDEFADQMAVQGVENPPAFEDMVDMTALEAAQASLDRDNEPEETSLSNPAADRVDE